MVVRMRHQRGIHVQQGHTAEAPLEDFDGCRHVCRKLGLVLNHRPIVRITGEC